MKKIQISLPKKLLETIDSFVSRGMYLSRSEYIRETLRERLESEGDLKD